MRYISSISLIALLAATGCASVVGPTKQQVKIDSVPQGAEVFVDGRTVTTPAIVTLKGKSEYYIQAKKPGYQDTPEKIDSEVRIMPAIVGNIFNLTGLIGMAVDFLGTGAAYKLDENVNVTMKPLPQPTDFPRQSAPGQL